MLQLPASFQFPLAIGIGGFVGALMRFYVSNAVVRVSGEDYRFLGTLTVNLIGCFAIGIVATVAVRSTHLSPMVQKCLITGLLGSLTTFSTFALESLALVQDGRYGVAAVKIGVSLVAGMLLVWAGALTASALLATDV